MKKIIRSFALFATAGTLFASCEGGFLSGGKKDSTDVKKDTMSNTSAIQSDSGWITLFDGTSLNGWRGYGRQDVPKAWAIDNGALKISGSGAGEAGNKDGGDLIFGRKFKNFELTFEYKVSKGGNSGVFYLAQEVPKEPIWKSSPEYQVLDNDNHPDAKLGKDGNRKSASLYDLIPAKPQNAKPAGEWNTGGIMVYKGTVVHKQNDVNVVEYHLWTPDWEKMIDNSKFKGWPNFIKAGGDAHEGYIGLQDHGDDIWFRNIKIKVLD